ncbi:hypothetical protein FACS189491_04320 [Spirochaetia bacterium]|nr:hypothetical protein FACS189491_04320 [Spirochaetia bacterium]
MKTNFCSIMLLLCCISVLKAEEPVHTILFSSGESNASDDHYAEMYNTFWLSNHECVAYGWYFNRNTNRFIPPYFDFPGISPYNGKTCFWHSADNLYLSDLDSYAQGLPPQTIPVPAAVPRLDGAAGWIGADEILFLSVVDDEYRLYNMEHYRYIVYSVSKQTWKEIDGAAFPTGGTVRGIRSYKDNLLLAATTEPEIPFLIYQAARYDPKTESFSSDTDYRGGYSEMGDRGGVSPFGITYDVNLLENGEVYFSGLIGRVCLIIEADVLEFTKSIILPELREGREYTFTRLSPNGNSLLTAAREPLDFDADWNVKPSKPPVIYIFDGRVSHSYRWTVHVKEDFGLKETQDFNSYTIDDMVKEVFRLYSIPMDETSQKRISAWMRIFNGPDGTDGNALKKIMIIPLRGSFLYMLGRGNETFTVEAETIR